MTIPKPDDAAELCESIVPGHEPDAERVRPYVPRTFQQHLVDDPTGRWWTAEGTAAFVDISGFTQLSEQLARKGREGAEQITDTIGGSFESILLVAYQNGGGLLKFGGDALLLWFPGEDHVERACRATVLMRRVLDKIGCSLLSAPPHRLGFRRGRAKGVAQFTATAAIGDATCQANPSRNSGWRSIDID
jgi:class 3 adenylate cyclase